MNNIHSREISGLRRTATGTTLIFKQDYEIDLEPVQNFGSASTYINECQTESINHPDNATNKNLNILLSDFYRKNQICQEFATEKNEKKTILLNSSYVSTKLNKTIRTEFKKNEPINFNLLRLLINYKSTFKFTSPGLRKEWHTYKDIPSLHRQLKNTLYKTYNSYVYYHHTAEMIDISVINAKSINVSDSWDLSEPNFLFQVNNLYYGNLYYNLLDTFDTLTDANKKLEKRCTRFRQLYTLFCIVTKATNATSIKIKDYIYGKLLEMTTKDKFSSLNHTTSTAVLECNTGLGVIVNPVLPLPYINLQNIITDIQNKTCKICINQNVNNCFNKILTIDVFSPTDFHTRTYVSSEMYNKAIKEYIQLKRIIDIRAPTDIVLQLRLLLILGYIDGISLMFNNWVRQLTYAKNHNSNISDNYKRPFIYGMLNMKHHDFLPNLIFLVTHVRNLHNSLNFRLDNIEKLYKLSLHPENLPTIDQIVIFGKTIATYSLQNEYSGNAYEWYYSLYLREKISRNTKFSSMTMNDDDDNKNNDDTDYPKPENMEYQDISHREAFMRGFTSIISEIQIVIVNVNIAEYDNQGLPTNVADFISSNHILYNKLTREAYIHVNDEFIVKISIDAVKTQSFVFTEVRNNNLNFPYIVYKGTNS
jgi:hypothetical protein